MSDQGDRTIIVTDGAPAAIGPYSQAIVANGFVFTAGQIPLDPETMKLVEGDISAQTERVMENLLGGAGRRRFQFRARREDDLFPLRPR